VSLIKAFRKIFHYFFLIFSTLITPPDIFSQLSISLCLTFNYEILVFYFIFKKLRTQRFLVS
jgi:Sec-independent protein secretion pathway component TatC